MILAGGYANIGARSLRREIEGERHHGHETILRYVRVTMHQNVTWKKWHGDATPRENPPVSKM